MFSQKIIKSITLKRFLGQWAITVIVLVGAMSGAEAAEWRIDPIVRIAADFDDNPFLSIRTDLEENVSGYVAEAAAKVAYGSDKTSFYITPRVRSINYGEEALDSDDQFVRFNFDHRTTSTYFRIGGNYARESTRTAERADTDLEVEDPEEIPDDESGRVGILALGRREIFSLSPYFSYDLSSVSSLVASVNYYDVRYDEVFLNLLTDYTDARFRLSYRRGFSSRNTGMVTASYRNFQSDDSVPGVAGVALTAGFERAMTENTRFRVEAGIEDTEISATETDANWIADVSLSKYTETTSLLAQYRRTISASGIGRLSTRDSVNLNFTRRLSELVSAGIGARVYSTNAVVGSGNSIFDEQDYVQLRAQFIWHLSPIFSVEADYRYTFIDRITLGESANSNRVSLWFVYTPRPFIRSR